MVFINKTVLTIAFKFNDILYAINTEEWKKAEKHKLIIFYNDTVPGTQFPFQELFDEVIHFHYTHDVKSVARSILHIIKVKKQILADSLITSIPLLLIVRLIFSMSKAKEVIWMEDGLLNYDKPDSKLLQTGFIHAKTKDTVQWLLGIDEKNVINNISSTYLLLPEEAIYFYGKKKRLTIEPGKYKKFDFLKGKRLLIGQNIYPMFCSFDKYIEVTNKVINDYQIDYYIPHLLADLREYEMIKGNILNLSQKRVTLEMIASTYSFTIVSYGSSLLYTAKVINDRVKTIYLKQPYYDLSSFPIIEKFADQIETIQI